MLLEVRWETKPPFLVSIEILGFLSIFKKSQASATLKHKTPRASRGVKRCEVPCEDEAEYPALGAGKFRVPNQTGKEPQCA